MTNTILDYTQKAVVFVAFGPISCIGDGTGSGLTIHDPFSPKILGTSVALIASAIFTAIAASKVTAGTSLVIVSAVAIVSGPTTLFAAGILTAKWGLTAIIHAVAFKHIAVGVGSLILGIGLWAINPITIVAPFYRGGLLGNYINNTFY